MKKERRRRRKRKRINHDNDHNRISSRATGPTGRNGCRKSRKMGTYTKRRRREKKGQERGGRGLLR